MATKVIKIGHTQDDNGMIASVISPKPPFQTNAGINAKNYVVGTDFTSGDDILFEIEGSDTIRFASVQSLAGAVIAHTEANLASPRFGKSIAIAAQAASFRALFIFNT